MRDKIYFIFTGEAPLDHPDEIQLIEQMLDDSLKLFHYKPVLLSIGIATLLEKVPPAVVKELKDVLPKPNDKRAAQVLYCHEKVYKFCRDLIEKLQLDDAPPLFDTEDVDWAALIAFNKKEVAFTAFIMKN